MTSKSKTLKTKPFRTVNNMTYRKVEVNGQTYEYVVGIHVTKVKGLGVFDNQKIGALVAIDTKWTADSDRDGAYMKRMITPAIVRKVIADHLAVV